MSLIQCPHCTKGKTMITVTTHETPGPGPFDPNNYVTTTNEMEMTCVTCNGTSYITTARHKAILDFNDSWCKCATPGDPIFVDDGEDERCSKHHYDCSACGGIMQVG